MMTRVPSGADALVKCSRCLAREAIDPKAANNLSELAEEYAGKAELLTL
jgi:hypothetical protein